MSASPFPPMVDHDETWRQVHQAAAEIRPASNPRPKVELLAATDIQMEPVRWLWQDWLARGKIHILGGRAGTGKTTLALSLAATLTQGGRWPDGSRVSPAKVVIWSGEDDPTDTLVPRLAAAGADLSMCHVVRVTRIGNEVRPFDPAIDVRHLQEAVDNMGGVGLILVDPIVSAIAGDSHKNAETRRGLQPLADLATATGTALVGITHTSKGTQGQEPVERITGSLAFAAVARVVLIAAKDRESDDRMLVRAKSNNGPDDGGFKYGFEQVAVDGCPGVMASRVEWGAALHGNARELLAGAESEPKSTGARDDAKRFLADLLDDGPKPQKEIKADAEGAGYTWATIRRAKDDIGVLSRKEGKSWYWNIPKLGRCSLSKEGAHPPRVSTFEHLHSDDPFEEAEL